MTTFVGYSTINRNKNFTVVDSELVKQDLINVLNTPQGQLPGVPQFGTVIWNYIFEPQLQETQSGIYEEMQRVAGLDPRLSVNNIEMFPWQNGILLQMEVTIVPSSVSEMLYVFLNGDTRSATYVTPS